MNTSQRRGPSALASNGGAPHTGNSRCSCSVDRDEADDNVREAGLGPLLDEREAAAELRLSRSTFRRFREAGLIAPVRLPLNIKRNLYARADVLGLAGEIAAGNTEP